MVQDFYFGIDTRSCAASSLPSSSASSGERAHSGSPSTVHSAPLAHSFGEASHLSHEPSSPDARASGSAISHPSDTSPPSPAPWYPRSHASSRFASRPPLLVPQSPSTSKSNRCPTPLCARENATNCSNPAASTAENTSPRKNTAHTDCQATTPPSPRLKCRRHA